MSVIWHVDRSKLLEPFASDVNELLHNDDDQWVVTQGWRSIIDQSVLYASYQRGGPLAAPPGDSAHEKGLAVDVTLIRNGRDVWDYKNAAWRRLVHKIHMHPRLHSLDDHGDTDHIEAVNWRRVAAEQPRSNA